MWGQQNGCQVKFWSQIIITTKPESHSCIFQYHQILLVFCDIVKMFDENKVSSYNILLYSQVSNDEG